MASQLEIFALSFGLVFAVELPDKTLLATLLLTTRYRASAVFLGVSVAFVVQCAVAVAFGGLLTLLPHRWVALAVGVLFGIGAAMLLREGFSQPESDNAPSDHATGNKDRFWPAAFTSFGVLFAAEWGDASQLATAGLATHYANPIAVGIGSLLALLTVTSVAIVVGRKVKNLIKPRLIQRIAGVVFGIFALVAAGTALAG